MLNYCIVFEIKLFFFLIPFNSFKFGGIHKFVHNLYPRSSNISTISIGPFRQLSQIQHRFELKIKKYILIKTSFFLGGLIAKMYQTIMEMTHK